MKFYKALRFLFNKHRYDREKANNKPKKYTYEFKGFNTNSIIKNHNINTYNNYEELQFFNIIKEMLNNPDKVFYRKCWDTAETPCKYIFCRKFNKEFISYYIRDDGISCFDTYKFKSEDILANDWIEKED